MFYYPTYLPVDCGAEVVDPRLKLSPAAVVAAVAPKVGAVEPKSDDAAVVAAGVPKVRPPPEKPVVAEVAGVPNVTPVEG